MPILFLDFDGVLRKSGSPLYKLESELVNNLGEVLRATAEVKIVITSSWREVFGLNELRRPFSADIASRIEGCTPTSLDPPVFIVTERSKPTSNGFTRFKRHGSRLTTILNTFRTMHRYCLLIRPGVSMKKLLPI